MYSGYIWCWPQTSILWPDFRSVARLPFCCQTSILCGQRMEVNLCRSPTFSNCDTNLYFIRLSRLCSRSVVIVLFSKFWSTFIIWWSETLGWAVHVSLSIELSSIQPQNSLFAWNCLQLAMLTVCSLKFSMTAKHICKMVTITNTPLQHMRVAWTLL